MSSSLTGNCQKLLSSGCIDLKIGLKAKQEALLLAYTEQLYKWNKVYNLTAIREPEAMLKLHILDSLSVLHKLAELRPVRLIDVGTGAGLPGVVLAIMWPQVEVHLLDTNGKKTRFLRHCKHLLALKNVTVLNKRAAQHRPEQCYDIVVSRAFAAINDMLVGCDQLVSSKGVFTPMKGQYPEAELAAMPRSYKLLSSTQLQVPGVDAERHLLIIEKNNHHLEQNIRIT